MPKACVIYARVSTAEQAAPGHHSLDAQEALCRRYAEQHGYEAVEVIRDEGYSGRTIHRPGLKRLFEYTGETPPTRIHAIIAQDTSRVGRDTTEYLLFRRQLKQRGIDLVAVTQPNIDASPEGQLVDTILAGINQYQSEEKARRVMIAMEKKFREGWWPGWAPVGYRNIEQDGRHEVGLDPVRFPIVRVAFTRYATGRYTQDALRKLLEEKGLTGRDGRLLPRVTLSQMLANPFYWGLMRWNGLEQIGKHPPATDRRTWERCQQVTTRHNKFAPRERKHWFLLAGLTICAACRTPQTHTVVVNKQKRYYHCRGRNRCSEPYVSADELEVQAERFVRGIQLSPRFVMRVIGRVRRLFQDRHREVQRERDALQRRKAALEQKRNVAEEKLLAGVISDDAFTRIMRLLSEQVDAVRDRLEEIESARQVDADSLRQVLQCARDFPRAYSYATPEVKRRYLAFFFTHFVVKDRAIVEAHPSEFLAAVQGIERFEQSGSGSPGRSVFEPLLRLLGDPDWLGKLHQLMRDAGRLAA